MTPTRGPLPLRVQRLSGSLDHAMSTDVLTGKVTGLAHWNINAVESFAYQYDDDSLIGGPGTDVLKGGNGANQLQQEGPES